LSEQKLPWYEGNLRDKFNSLKDVQYLYNQRLKKNKSAIEHNEQHNLSPTDQDRHAYQGLNLDEMRLIVDHL
jgi:hypothetical protein